MREISANSFQFVGNNQAFNFCSYDGFHSNDVFPDENYWVKVPLQINSKIKQIFF